MSHIDTETPDIWFKSKRVLRTATQVLVAGIVFLGGLVAIAPQVLEAVQDVLPGPVVAWLVGAIAFLAGISAALSRVMAIPAVNAWLVTIGLGSVPKATLAK